MKLGNKMTTEQKNKFHKLFKNMEYGKEHQKILRNIHHPVKAADAFHNLVLKLAQK